MPVMKSKTNASVPETKLHPPQTHRNVLPRPDLFTLLDGHQTCRLILVSAPAGYGKSTFLTMWSRRAPTTVAWVSLDDFDNDPLRFWTTLLQAITTVQPNLLRRSMSILQFGGQLALDALWSAFISDLKDYAQDLTIILDDYHVIREPSIHRSIEYVIKRLPHHAHFAIATRGSLPFSISQLRLQGQVVEIGIDELRFNAGEIRSFYSDVLRMTLPETVVTRIAQLTEGWVSGMQLAALIMRNEQSPANFSSRFGGGHQLVAEFLTDEVLRAQTDIVQKFLLETSILDRMTGSLCTAITGIEAASDILQKLQRTNSFIISLDEERVWFRYHHLFSEFLHHRLKHTDAVNVLRLHRRAALWFESQGFTVEAVEHAIQAEDYNLAVDILDKNSTTLLHTGELDTLLQWFERIPRQILLEHPVAGVLHGWVLALSQRLEPALQLVSEVRESLGLQQQNRQSEDLTLELNVLRGYIAILQRHTGLALKFMTASVAHSSRYSKFLLRGVNLNSGEPFVLPSRLGMRGYLRSAFELYTGLREIWKHSGLATLGYGSAVMGELFYEWNDLEKLDYFIPRGLELGRTFQDAGILVPLHLLHAKYLRARRMRTEMWQSIDELEHWLQDSALDGHWQDIIIAFTVRLWVEENQADKVTSWLDASWDRQQGHVTAVGEYEMMTMARVLIYLKRWKAAGGLLSKLLRFAEMEDRLASKIEISLLQTRLHGAQGDERRALLALHRAVHLAMPEGYQRMFVDEGEPLAFLLRRLLAGGYKLSEDEISYVQTLVQAMDDDILEDERLTGAKFPTGTVVAAPSYIEPLTNREQEILKAIEKGLTNADIAKQLGLSVGTVKVYTHYIFSKLGVKNRTQAVAKARALSLFSNPG